MNDKQKNIQNFLAKHQGKWVTSTELAAFCACTTRTIRNQIAKLNGDVPNLILTSNQGYQLNQQVASGNQEITSDRKSQIFLELLKHSNQGVNIYDLAETFHLSESTLKKDIEQLNREVVDKNIQIVLEGNCFKVTGSERSKRRYMISLLYNENDIQEVLKVTIQQMIGYISLEKLEETIRRILVSRGIQINQYSLTNIVLHYAISIERIRQGHIVTKNPRYQGRQPEYEIAEEIAKSLAKDYHIHFPEAELIQLSLLFIGLQNERSASHGQELTDFVEPKIIETLDKVLEQVAQTYLVELTDVSFFNKLAIHLQSLYLRSQYQQFTRNSHLLDLKTGYPLTYDLSVYISSLIQEELGIWFNDDEISFIALHIGAFLETQKTSQSNVVILLVVNDYHDIGRNLQETLRTTFHNQVVLISEATKIDQHTYDLLVTTDRNVASDYPESVVIPPFITPKELKKIERRLQSLKEQKQKKVMENYVDQFIIEELYFNQVDPSGLKPRDIRSQLNQRLLQQSFVDETFQESVEKRERLSPTSFPSGIAVPHAIEFNALKSGVSVMTLQDAIIWSGYPIKLVAMIAINQREAKVFNTFFETFIEIVSDPINTKQLSMAEDYGMFILRLKRMINQDFDIG